MNFGKGYSLVIFAALCFSLMNLFLKLSPAHVLDKVFYRSLINLLILLPFASEALKNFIPTWKRSVFGTLALCLSFWSLSYIGLAEHSILVNSTPIWTVFLLGLPIFPAGIFSVVSLSGLVLLQYSELSHYHPKGLLLAMACGFVTSVNHIQIKKLLTDGHRARSMIFNFMLVACITSIFLKFLLTHEAINFSFDWYLLIGAIFGAIAQGTMTTGYRYLDSYRSSIAISTSPVFGVLLAWAFLGERMGLFEILGVVIVILMNAVVSKVQYRF